MKGRVVHYTSRLFLLGTLGLLMLVLTGCAQLPDQAERQQRIEQDIEAILSQPAEGSAYTETRRCLSPGDYRDMQALDDRHILFEGRGGQLWVNTLTMRCPDLRHASVLRVRSLSSMGRICRQDTFEAGSWFDWPWYRRSPWRWHAPWHSGMRCALGDFQAVTPTQVEALRRAMRAD